MLEICTLIDHFGEDEGTAWFVVNDNVMGGRSSGGLSVRDGILFFEGDLNTNGGGFSSIRRPLDPGMLAGASHLKLAVEADDRSYRMTFRTDARSKGRPISYQAPLTIGAPDDGDPYNASVNLSVMRTTVFGRRVDAPPFQAAKADEMGFIIADKKDGPFRLAISSMAVCK